MPGRTYNHSSQPLTTATFSSCWNSLLFCNIFIASYVSSVTLAQSHNCQLVSLIFRTGHSSSGNRISRHLEAHNTNALTYMVWAMFNFCSLLEGSQMIGIASRWHCTIRKLLDGASPSQNLLAIQRVRNINFLVFSFHFLIHVLFPRFTFTDIYYFNIN